MDIRLATEYDDGAIRQLLQQIPLDGTMRIRYLREPSYLNSIGLQGLPQQTLVGFIEDRLVAVGSRNLQKLHINGEVKTAGYISNLRYHPDARNGFRLLKGIRFMENLSSSATTDFHYATFISSDRLSMKILASNRPRMPVAFDMGCVVTVSIPLKKHKTKPNSTKQYEIIQADEGMMPNIMDFLNSEGVKKDLFPVLDNDSYAPELLKPSSFFMIFNKGNLSGVCSVPDIKNYKQYSMEGFARAFGFVRVPLNFYFALRSVQAIPNKGESIQLSLVGFPVVKDDDPEIFRALITFVYNSLSGSGQHYLTIALHERNPLIRSLSHFPKVVYKSRLYLVKLEKDSFSPFKDLEVNSSQDQFTTNGFWGLKQIPFIDLLRL